MVSKKKSAKSAHDPPSTRMRLAGKAVQVGCWFLLVALVSPSALGAAQDSFQVNDRVQTNANGLGWINGTVVAIGTASQTGNVKVHADGYANDFWVRVSMASAIRRLAGESPAAEKAARASAALDRAEATTPPRLGKYLVMSYGASNPLHLGYVVLMAGGSYKFLDMGGTATGQGRYEYDGGTTSVRWLSGPVRQNNWGGQFDITREGKTCQRTLKSGQ